MFINNISRDLVGFTYHCFYCPIFLADILGPQCVCCIRESLPRRPVMTDKVERDPGILLIVQAPFCSCRCVPPLRVNGLTPRTLSPAIRN